MFEVLLIFLNEILDEITFLGKDDNGSKAPVCGLSVILHTGAVVKGIFFSLMELGGH